jgi:hypothetical protein
VVLSWRSAGPQWSIPLSSTLTCWKEIAEYLHKGVRTVQRYERQMGLPVRRPHGQQGGVVLAFSDEVDAWVRSHFEGGRQSELEILREELAEVKTQNRVLRARLERAERAATVIRWNGNASVEHWAVDIVLLERAFHAIEKSNAIRLHSAELIGLSRSTKALRRRLREQFLMFSQPSLVN